MIHLDNHLASSSLACQSVSSNDSLTCTTESNQESSNESDQECDYELLTESRHESVTKSFESMTESRHILSVQSSLQSSVQSSMQNLESSHESSESSQESSESSHGSSESESDVNESPVVPPFTAAFADPTESDPLFCPNPPSAQAAAPSPAVRAVKLGFLGGEGKKGRKYILSGRVNGQLFHQLVDSAADISVIPQHMVKKFNLREDPLKRPFMCDGFQNSTESAVLISTTCSIPTNLGCGVFPVIYHVAPIGGSFALLGSDVIGDKSSGVGFESNSGILRYDGNLLYTKKSLGSSISELRRRERMGEKSYRRLNAAIHAKPTMRNSRRVTVGPRSMAWVEAYVSGQPVSQCHSFLSFYAEDDDLVTIPNFVFYKKHHRYRLPVINETSQPLTFPAGQILGDVIQHRRLGPEDETAPSVYHVVSGKALRPDDLPGGKEGEETQQQQQQQQQRQPEQHERQQQQQPGATTVKQESPQRQQHQQQQQQKEVRFSEVEDVNKLDNKTLSQFHKEGIRIDKEMNPNLIDVEGNFERLEVNVDEERKKGKVTDMWDDISDEEYLKLFKKNPSITEAYEDKYNQILLDFKQCFYNPKKPQKFSGLKMKPIEVEAKPGTVPKKDRLRRASDIKEPYILEHLEKMKNEGVIREANNLSVGYLSNVVLVLESRYVAAEGRNVAKSRFCLDYRKVNQDMLMTHWHLPNMDDFRREMASGDYKVFTNLDCCSFYYQLKVSEKSSQFFSGFWAANKLWIMMRLPMGWSLSGSWGQFWMDQAFRDHPHCKPFMDDISLFSKDMDEMLDTDLPLCLAICSTYNLLLSPKKAELCTDRLRVLGFDVGEGSRGISSEKVEKIQNLKFPETKAELISSLAFFSWFLSCNPRLSDAMGPLRDLAKPKVKFLPTQAHREAFEQAKARLLDPALGRLRTPSSRIEDDIIVATDSSHYALGAVVLQKLPPTSTEVAAGVPADEKQLYLVQVISKTLPPEKRNLPIYIKEFYALDLAVEKFDFLLRARPFLVVVDNKTLRYWANLSRIDDAMARRVLKLQSYDFKILFIETRIQPADQVSRWEEDDKSDGVYQQRFLQGRILNGDGKEVPLESLFCDKTKLELERYFSSSKKTTQSIPAEADNPKQAVKQTSKHLGPDLDPTCSGSLDHGHHLKTPAISTTVKRIGSRSGNQTSKHASNHALRPTRERVLEKTEVMLLPSKHRPDSRAKTRRQRRAMRRWERRNQAINQAPDDAAMKQRNCRPCHGCKPIGGSVSQLVDPHCGCLCERNDNLYGRSVRLVQLDDEDVAAGRVAGGDANTDDVLENQSLPKFNDQTVDEIKAMQQSDGLIKQMIEYVSGVKAQPEKHEMLLLPPSIKAFFRHADLFRCTDQGVLVRLWTSAEGRVRFLLVISDDELKFLIQKAHEFKPSVLMPSARGKSAVVMGERGARVVHAGVNRTMTTIGRYYYHHSLRATIKAYIQDCAVCVVNNHPRGKKDDKGLQTPMGPGMSLAVDFAGPWHSESTYKYLFCAIDLFSRYGFCFPVKSTKDADVLECLLEIRRQWSGLPQRLHMDSVLCQSRSVSTTMLKKMGISLTHSMPNNSVCQAKVERYIGTISRSILKIQTASPGTPFKRVIDEAVLQYNNTCTDILGGRCPSEFQFFKANANLMDVDGHVPLDGLTGDSRTFKHLVDARLAMQDEVLHNDVRRFVQRRDKENPGDRDDKIKVGDYALKKRTSFWSGAPRKLQFKVDEDAFEVVSKLATNSYKCISLMTGDAQILPGEQIVKTKMSREKLQTLVRKMSELRALSNGDPAASRRPSRRRGPLADAPVVSSVEALLEDSHVQSFFKVAATH